MKLNPGQTVLKPDTHRKSVLKPDICGILEFKKDLLIYFVIIAMTGLIVGLSHLQLKTVGIFLIVPIACTEAVMLAYYFMHLMTKKKTIHLVLLLTFVVLLNILFWPAWDISYSQRTPSEFTIY